jgi:hypothetical protein
VLLEVAVPINAGQEKKRNRGFAFLTLETREQAEQAMECMNGKKVGMNRTVAVDWVIPKDQFVQLEEKADLEDDAMSVAEESSAVENVDDDSMDHDGDASDGEESDLDIEMEPESDVEMQTDDVSDQDEDADSDGDSDSVKITFDDEDGGESDNETVEKDAPPAKKESDVQEGKTLFIRNLAFEATDEALVAK